jgi:hypothetical protein
MAADVALSASSQSAPSWLANLFQSSSDSTLQLREDDLKELVAIRADQELAWRDYVLARRSYAKAVKDERRQEMNEIAAGNLNYGTTLSDTGSKLGSKAAKLNLKQKYEALYATLDGDQRTIADRELTPSECGR